jgi:cytoskeletal protein CcmA (bactofilin family)
MLRPFIAIACAFALCTLPALAQDEGTVAQREFTRNLGMDHFAAGESVNVTGSFLGDLLAAGRNVVFDGSAAGDAVLAGGQVRLNGAVSQNLYAAGGQVFVNGSVARNARLAGGEVEITPTARIDGGVTVGAGQTRVNGTIGGYLQAATGEIYINGTISGDAEVSAGQVELGPQTRIAGELRYRSDSQLIRDPAAQVLGGVRRIPSPQVTTGFPRGLGRALFWLWTLGLMLLVVLLIPALPGFFAGAGQMLRSRPGISALLGFALLLLTPIAAVFLMITFIGAPLGFFSMAAYFALLMVGYAAAGAALGQWLLGRMQPDRIATVGRQIGAAVLGILLVALLAQIPVLGGFVVVAALLLGMGAVVLHIKRAVHPATP